MAQIILEEAATNPQPSPPRQPGSAVGIVTYIAEDFDAPLDDFDEGDEQEPCPKGHGYRAQTPGTPTKWG